MSNSFQSDVMKRILYALRVSHFHGAYPLARFVLARAYVNDALLGIKVFPPHVLYVDAAH